jgi:hypothetical protein
MRRARRWLAVAACVAAVALSANGARASQVRYRPLDEILQPEVRVFSAKVIEIREPAREGELRREMRVDDIKPIRGEIATGLRAVDYTEIIPSAATTASPTEVATAPSVVLPGSGREREIRAGQRWIFFTSTNTRAETWTVMRAEPAEREKHVRTSISRSLADAGEPPPLVFRLPPRPDAAAAPIPEAGPETPAPPPAAAKPRDDKGCAGCSTALFAVALVTRPRRRERERHDRVA